MNRILLIDDEPQLRAALADALRSASFEVAEASDGAQGAKLQQSYPADLVITDIFMPEQDGIETIVNLLSANPALKIIAITGGYRGGEYNYLSVAALIGAERCLQKPFTIAHLLATVREVLGIRSAD